MDEKTQQEFIAWMAKKYKISDQNKLMQVLQQMGPDEIKKHFAEFQQEKQMFEAGGKFDYIKSLYNKKPKTAKKCTTCEKLKAMN